MSRTAFLFPGQGAQSVGMGRHVVESCPEAGRLFQRAAEILGYDLLQLCLEGPAAKLDSTVHSQPALFVASLAALEDLRSRQPELVDSCQAAAGLSLGEYTALVTAGVMSFEDALRVVRRRGEAMQAASDAQPSGMVSVLGLEPPVLEELVDKAREQDVLRIANYLCPGNLVVSGDTKACQRLAALAEQAGAMKVIPLAVAGAFHTRLMQSAVAQLEEVLSSVPLSPGKIPVISNVDGKPHSDPDEIRPLLVQQVVSPVRWEDSMRYLLAEGFDQFYEIGPGRVLRGLLKRIHRKVACENVPA